MSKGDRKGKGNIVIRKEEVVEGGHHGGAWKVAYADFVTAMMAFFLLMWLLNATTEEQRKGLADYFSPQNAFAHNMSGSGKPFGGKTPYEDGAMVSDRGAVEVVNGTAQPIDAESLDTTTPAQPGPTPMGSDPNADAASGSGGSGAGTAGNDTAGAAASGDAAAGTAQQGRQGANAAQAAAFARQNAAEAARREQANFEAAAQQLREAVRNDPDLAPIAHQLAIEETPEGLRIQILDEDKRAMFAFGSSDPNETARLLLKKVAPVLAKLTEKISVTGHTDAAPYRGTDKSNWELSADRANATRRLLMEGGLPDGRFSSVTGDADRDPLLPAEPLAAANRRIAIVVLRRAVAPAVLAQAAPMVAGGTTLAAGTPPAR